MRVVRFVNEHPGVSSKRIAEGLGVPAYRVQSELAQAIKWGRLRREGPRIARLYYPAIEHVATSGGAR